jgi:glutamine synthetase
MSVIEISNLSQVEKLQVMEAIWLDLREHVDGAEVPADHQEILDARRQRVMSGESTLQDWDSIKDSIGRA